MSRSESEVLHVESSISKVVRTVIMDDPEVGNALSDKLVCRLRYELSDAAADAVSVFVIRSSDQVFCDGFDVRSLGNEDDDTLALRFCRIALLLDELYRAPFVTVACVEGSAVGAGADLALACDFRLGTPTASMRFLGPAFGVVLGARRLAAITNGLQALNVEARASGIDAQECLRLGLLTEVDNPEVLEHRIQTLAGVMSDPSAEIQQSLLAATRHPDHAMGLADLLRSVVRPGLAEDVQNYVRRTRATHSQSA